MYLWAVRNLEDAVKESCWSPLSVAVGQECSQGRLQCSRGRSLHVKFNSTKSCLKALTAQLCIHKINQQQLRSLDLGPLLTLAAHDLFGKDWVQPYRRQQSCMQALASVTLLVRLLENHKSSEMTQIFRNQLHPICNGYADFRKIIFHSLKASQQES